MSSKNNSSRAIPFPLVTTIHSPTIPMSTDKSKKTSAKKPAKATKPKATKATKATPAPKVEAAAPASSES